MSPTLRVAKPSDVPAIVPLWFEEMNVHSAIDPRFPLTHEAEGLFVTDLSEKLSDPNTFIYVAELNTSVIAFCIAQVTMHSPIFSNRHFGFINHLMVASAYRRQGIGRALFEVASEALKSHGANAIEVSFVPQNVMSSLFWRKLGFSTRLETARLEQSAT